MLSNTFDNTQSTLSNKVNEDFDKIDVPYWEQTPIHSVDDLPIPNPLQQQFYLYYKTQFLQNRYLDIGENSNYAFVLMFDLADDYKKHKKYALLKEQLDTLAQHYPIVTQHIHRVILNAVTIVNQENAANILKSYNGVHDQLCQWVRSNEIIEIQGIKLTRGNFYVGECFRLPDNVIKYK